MLLHVPITVAPEDASKSPCGSQALLAALRLKAETSVLRVFQLGITPNYHADGRIADAENPETPGTPQFNEV